MMFRRKLAACMTAAALMTSLCSVTAFADTEYPLWVGSTQVTDANKDDILNDGGKAKYDPETQTLTLDNPTITGYHSDHGYSAQVFADGFALTLSGKADFDYNSANAFLAVWDYQETLTIKDAEFTATGFDSGFVSCNYEVHVENSSIKVIGTDISSTKDSFALAGKIGVKVKDSYIESEKCGRPFSGESIIIEGLSTVVRMTAASDATGGVVVSCDDLQILEPLTVLEPEGAVINGGRITDAQGNNAKKLVITNEQGYGEVEVVVNGEGTAYAEKKYYGYGGTVKINAQPAEGYRIKNVDYLIPDSEPAKVGENLEFQMPASDKVTVVVYFDEIHNPELVEEVPATCEETGVKAHYKCQCGKLFEDAEATTEITDPDTLIIPALGHDWDEGEVILEPTATEEGVKLFTCKNDPSHTRTEAIPALGEDESSESEISEVDSSEAEPESSVQEEDSSKAEEDTSKAPEGNKGGSNPNTGKAAVCFALLAVAGAVVLIVFKRKK